MFNRVSRFLIMMTACPFVLGSCGPEKSANPQVSADSQGQHASDLTVESDSKGGGIDDVASVEAVSAGIVPAEVPRIDGYPVEDNVPKSAYPALREIATVSPEDLTAYQNRLIKMNICLGRWDDPIGHGERIRTWHICDASSIWTNP